MIYYIDAFPERFHHPTFSGNTDPLLGSDASAQFDELFRRIVALMSPPLGLGSAS
jgi:hypothetical protein